MTARVIVLADERRRRLRAEKREAFYQQLDAWGVDGLAYLAARARYDRAAAELARLEEAHRGA